MKRLILPRVLDSPAGLYSAIFLLVFLIHGALVARMGIQEASDTTGYSLWADILLREHFNYPNYWKEVSTAFSAIPYTGFVSLLACLKLLFGSHWMQALILINLLASAATGSAVVTLVWRLTHNRWVLAVVTILYLIAYDIYSWAAYVLSDTTFLALSFTIFFLLAGILLDSAAGKREALRWSAASFLLLLAIFYRPTGVLLLPAFLITFFAWQRLKAKKLKQTDRGANDKTPDDRFCSPRLFLSAGFLLGIVSMIGHSWIMQDVSRWPLRALRDTVLYNARLYQMGQVVWDRRETWHSPPETLLDFIYIAFDRLWHWFYFAIPQFSLLHNVSGVIFFVPVYAGTIATIYFLLRHWSGLEARQEAVVLISLTIAATFTFFHAMVQVDYDWRYRVPILPHLILLAGIGLRMFLSSLSLRNNKHSDAVASAAVIFAAGVSAEG